MSFSEFHPGISEFSSLPGSIAFNMVMQEPVLRQCRTATRTFYSRSRSCFAGPARCSHACNKLNLCTFRRGAIDQARANDHHCRMHD